MCTILYRFDSISQDTTRRPYQRLLTVLFRPVGLLCAFILTSHAGLAQEKDTPPDSIWTIEMPVMVITATKNATRLSEAPILTRVVTADEAKIQGALRMSDLLAELTGIFIVHDHGAGVQLQGFDSAYTLVLLDGEPIIGRTAGTLDLNRLPVSLIEQVEIVRGPSSSLYGSEALAGVINIITRRPRAGLRVSSSVRFESNQTTDLSSAIEIGGEKIGGRIQVNRFSSGGYDLTPNIIGLTAPGFSDYTLAGRFTFEPSDRTLINTNVRIARQSQSNTLGFKDGGTIFEFTEEADREDWNVSPRVRQRIGNNLIATAKGHLSSFSTRSILAAVTDEGAPDQINFRQMYRKGELQLDLILGSQHLLTLGGGFISESVTTERVTGGRRSNEDKFVFGQHQWLPFDWLHITTSGRLDAHSDYDTRISPKLAALFIADKSTRIRASVGSGFKAPTFQQLYMDFTNPVAGYSVVGATDIDAAIQRFEDLGQIQFFLSDLASVGEIRPEKSFSINLGVERELGERLSIELNLFRNQVRDLIETLPVATKPNGQNIFTYVNLNRIFTRGLDTDIRFRFDEHWSFGIGYQFLDTGDKEVIDEIEAGSLFKRVNGRDRRVRREEYGGLFNRSRHSGILRITFVDARRGLTAALRGLYRSRYGLGDLNGNLILDDRSEYVPGYLTLNLTVTKTISNSVSGQIGIRNMLGETNVEQIPSLPGRLVFGGLSIELAR